MQIKFNLTTFKILAGPAAALSILLFTDLQPGNPLVTRMAALTVWMAIWWLTEAVHMAVTSLIPVFAFPILGIANATTTSAQYMDQIIFLFIGGFIISFALERWNLHQRMAYRILSLTGSKPSRILWGIMLTTFLISMWISNTATTMMLFPAVLALANQLEQLNYKASNTMSPALLLGLAYAATIGGMTTLVGTPPNMIFYRQYLHDYPMNGDLNFTSWFIMALPVTLLLLACCYFLLRLFFLRKLDGLIIDRAYFPEQYRQLGPLAREEKIVLNIFILTAILWFTRSDIVIGSLHLKGWSSYIPFGEYIQDSTVAIFMAFILFLLPAGKDNKDRIINWSDVTKIPFGIILLFGAGFAIAKGFELSGLSEWMSEKLIFLKGANKFVMILVICLIVTVISEFASNVASIQLALPILISLNKDLNLHPLLLMVPATLAASLGFMLPIATAPNTIVFGSGKIPIKKMSRIGFILDVAGILVISVVIYLFF